MAIAKRGMQTVSEVVDRLTRAGYRDQFRAEAGKMRAVQAGCTHAPEDLRIDAIERFEGTTDPGDESIVFAVVCPDGVRGTWTATYGPQMEPDDAEVAALLGPTLG
jgi:hypothetical protein